MPVYLGRAITAFSLILISVYIWVASEEFPANGHQLPQLIAGLSIFLSLILLFGAFRTRDESEKLELDFSYDSKKQYFVLLLTIVYIPTMFVVGYYTSTIVLLVVSSVLVGIRNYKTIAITVLVSMPLMYAFFDVFLNAQLPRGMIY
ncbi:MAG: hypothetical protein HOG95_17125 [Rhodospirillaceae bacterium]|jgi:hypothetical protein|nr:hypothetical protein [Rhodospirillaceae bacterium]MBT7267915.1 hypothetical protein [Rhodospirillaceae bacterium]